MPGTSSGESREVREYVESQRKAFNLEEEVVELVQRVARRRVGGTTYSIYDVHMSNKSRWWVVTNHLNLYSQAELPSIEDVLVNHIGVISVTREQFRTDFDDPHESPPARALRRYSRAVESLAEAEEPEEFQAIGIKCRDALIALGEAYTDEPWVKMPEGEEPPKAADAKGWLRIYASSLCSSDRQRSYVRQMSEKTWDLAVSLQHDSNTTEWDAEIVLAATNAVFRTFSLLLTKRNYQEVSKCPECDSYRLAEEHDAEFTMTEGKVGIYFWSVCEYCGWTSEKEWDNWDAERLERAAKYVASKDSPPKRGLQDLDPDLAPSAREEDEPFEGVDEDPASPRSDFNASTEEGSSADS